MRTQQRMGAAGVEPASPAAALGPGRPVAINSPARANSPMSYKSAAAVPKPGSPGTGGYGGSKAGSRAGDGAGARQGAGGARGASPARNGSPGRVPRPGAAPAPPKPPNPPPAIPRSPAGAGAAAGRGQAGGRGGGRVNGAARGAGGPSGGGAAAAGGGAVGNLSRRFSHQQRSAASSVVDVDESLTLPNGWDGFGVDEDDVLGSRHFKPIEEEVSSLASPQVRRGLSVIAQGPSHSILPGSPAAPCRGPGMQPGSAMPPVMPPPPNIPPIRTKPKPNGASGGNQSQAYTLLEGMGSGTPTMAAAAAVVSSPVVRCGGAPAPPPPFGPVMSRFGHAVDADADVLQGEVADGSVTARIMGVVGGVTQQQQQRQPQHAQPPQLPYQQLQFNHATAGFGDGLGGPLGTGYDSLLRESIDHKVRDE